MRMTLADLYEAWPLTVSKIIKNGFLTFIILLILYAINSNIIAPFSLFEFWINSSEHWSNWYQIGRPLFAWGCGLQIFLVVALRNQFIREMIELNTYWSNFMFWSFLTGTFAGIIEEIMFRWLLFLANIILIKLINFLFFGWLGLGIWQVINNFIFAPIVNGLTLGNLDHYLVNPEIWFVGASMITTNAMFRDGHSYQGCLGWINSWFIGMFLFWVMFNYGLVTAIFIHIFYNFIVSVILLIRYFILITMSY